MTHQDPPVDLVPTLLAVGGPLLLLPTTQAKWPNIPNLNHQEVLTILMDHPVSIGQKAKMGEWVKLKIFGRHRAYTTLIRELAMRINSASQVMWERKWDF